MSRALVIALALLLGACRQPAPEHATVDGMGLTLARPTPPPRTAAVLARAQAQLDSVDVALAALQQAVERLAVDSAATLPAQEAFAAARDAYKRVEFMVEVYAPTAAWEMNGPALPSIDDQEAHRPYREPQGFQVIEEMLFPTVLVDECVSIASEVQNTRSLLARVRQVAAQATFSDVHVFDGMRQELARVVSLGLSGFDSPVARRSLVEAAEAWRGMRHALEIYRVDADRSALDSLLTLLDGGVASLRGGEGFEEFNRLQFIVQFAGPAGQQLARVRDGLGVGVPNESRLWRAEVATPYEREAFDALAFAPVGVPNATAEAVALGQSLFGDPALSRDGSRSCATCHVPELAFQDGRRRASAMPGAPATLRNVPTLLNSALQPLLHMDGRLMYLEHQASDVAHNVNEMGGELKTLAARWNSDSLRQQQFLSVFGSAEVHPDSATVTAARITGALAAYVRSLQATSSPFDRALRGDTLAVSAQVRRGFTVFMGKGLCGTCHFAPLFNGAVPARYEEAEFEALGVPATARWSNAQVDPDSGRGPLHGNPLHAHAFRVPTVRNAALTAPYMHNGVYATLEEVVRFYNEGGGAGIGVRLEHQTLPPDRLELTDQESADLVAFMRALTDTVTARR